MFHAWVTAIFSHSSWSLCCTDGCFWFRHPELLLFYKWLRVHFSEWQIVRYCSLLFLCQHCSVCFVPQLKTEILFCILNSMVQEIVIKILDNYSVVGFPSGKKLKNLEVCLFSVGILFGIKDWFFVGIFNFSIHPEDGFSDLGPMILIIQYAIDTQKNGRMVLDQYSRIKIICRTIYRTKMTNSRSCVDS